MQTGPMNAATALARRGWRQIAAIIAALVLAFALLATTGPAASQAAADAESGDGTEQVVAGKWSYGGEDPDSVPYPVRSLLSRGPSWT